MKIKEEFDCYFKTFNEMPSSIHVNKAASSFSQKEEYPYMACVRIFMNNPLENGLSNRDEYDMLLEIESKLIKYIDDSMDIIYVGKSTNSGMRDFFLYSQDFEPHIDDLEKVLQQFSDYDFELGYRPDEQWDIYYKFLLPHDEKH